MFADARRADGAGGESSACPGTPHAGGRSTARALEVWRGEVHEVRRYLYWWALRREARAYIRANSLRAVASAMEELDRHARLGDHRCAICSLRGGLIQALHAQGLCVAAFPAGCTGLACTLGPACPSPGLIRFTFVVEGRHYAWCQPEATLGFPPPAPDGSPHERRPCSAPTCLMPAARDALMAVVCEYVRDQGVPMGRPAWLPNLRQAIAMDLAGLQGGHGEG